MKVLIDMMNLVFISFNVAKRKAIDEKGEFTKDDMGFFYHLFINKINEISKEYGEFIVCSEGKGSLDYRRSIYPAYKRNRDESKTDETYLMIKDEFKEVERLLSFYPIKHICVEGAEADDVIYALSMHFAELGEDVLIVSSDGDLTQLNTFNKKISIYNPIKRTVVFPKENIVEYKAIVGDPSDGISGIPRLGKKTFEKMMLDESLFNEKLKGKEEEYKALLSIVDLRKYPKEYHQKAIDTFNEMDWNTFNPKEIEVFMFDKKLNQHIQFWWSVVSDINIALRQENREKETDFSYNEEKESEDVVDLDDLISSLEGLIDL